MESLGAGGTQPPRFEEATDTERVAAGVLYGQVPRYEHRPMTRFEAKGRALERPIADFALRRR